MSDFTWPTGGLWENDGILIRFDEPVDRIIGGSVEAAYGDNASGPPCPHAQNVTTEPYQDGQYDAQVESWTVPRVVIASGECGYVTTGVCADCVMDAMRVVDARRY